MKASFLAVVVSVVASWSSAALADATSECLDAASKGQTLRDAHRLIEARDQFRVCARQSCPAVVQRDCAGWLDTAERSLPTVVLTAKDPKGGDLVNVRVSVDGQPFATVLDGKAVAMNPGPHAFHFEAAGGVSGDRQVVVTEGEHDRAVAVVLGVAQGAPVAPVASSASGLRVAGWIISGLGAAGLVVGAVGGGVAIADKNSAHCNTNNICDSAALASTRTAAKVADAGLIAGGALLAGGVVMLVVSFASGHPHESAVTAAPIVGASAGGFALGGTW